MSSSYSFKKLFAKYKQFERIFFQADKNEEGENYIKLKYQFRMTVMFSFLLMLLSIAVMILQETCTHASILILAAVLIGFRRRWYSLPKILLLITSVALPFHYVNTKLVFAVPMTIMAANIQVLILTQSQLNTWAHLFIQTLACYFYGIEKITDKIQSMTVEEIAKMTKAAIYICLLMGWLNLIGMSRFYTHVNILIRKIGALRDDLAKVNNQLNDQNAKLQNNLEMKDVFIYTFSHELKNALNGILGNLTLAYDIASKDSQLIQFLSSAKVCGEVLKNFVHNILDTGKLENGNLEVCPERRDVMSFIENIWAVCGRIIENKRLQGYLEIEKNVPRYLELDEQRMIQIILNLVSNACKFTEKGHVRIQISWEPIYSNTEFVSQECKTGQTKNSHQVPLDQAIQKESEFEGDMREFLDSNEACFRNQEKLHLITERQKKFIIDPRYYQLSLSKWNWNSDEILLPCQPEKESKGVLKIHVIDTGCGMSPEDQAKLFQRFSQTNRKAGQRKIGTGLGLWICKELAGRLGGEIKTRSVVGVGSVFELAMRTTVANFNDKFPKQRTFSVCSDTSQCRPIRRQSQPNPKKILIADDDNFNVELMKNFLNKFEIGYICAYDGEEAASLFKQHYEDICFVITDNLMPKKTGTEAALEIKNFLKEMKKPKIPIICISGDVKVNVGETGITSVIQKPINFDRLKQELMVTYPQIDRKLPV